jgi:hypothetical protein
MSPKFDRFQPVVERTFSLRAFNRYETEINEHFWSFKAISEFSRFIAEEERKTDPSKSAAQVFKASGPDARRIPVSVSDWHNAREELENWLRVAALVSATSYFEAYLRQVVRSALMSDPMCRFDKPRSIDGITLLKRGLELPIDHEIGLITRGDWQNRIAGFKRVFGQAPAGLSTHLSSLEKMRNLRNDFAHGFGRGLSIPLPSDMTYAAAKRLSQPTFVRYVGVISKAAALIDRCLLSDFIGNFELIEHYHSFKSNPRDPRDGSYNETRALQRTITRDLGCSVSTEFCQGLIDCYAAS